MADAFDAAWDISKDDEMVSIKVQKDMVPMIERIMMNPEIYHDVGYDGTMAGPYGGFSMKRPDMSEMYDPHDDSESPLSEDYTGMYAGADGDIRGELSKIRLLDALKRMGLL